MRYVLYLCHLFNDRGRFRRRLPDNEHRVAPSMKKRDREREGVCDRRGEESFSDFQRSGREKSRRVCENGRHKALRLLNKRKGHGEHHGMLDFVCVRHV